MIKLMTAVLTVVAFVKNLIFGKDTSHVNGDILYPGHVNFANKGGDMFHGAKVKYFFTLRGLNEWCLPGAEGANALIAEVLPTLFGYTIIYTRNLSRKDIDTIDRYGREINAKIAAENQKFEMEEQELRDEEAKVEAEQKRLAAVGAKYEKRIAKIRDMAPGLERKRAEKELNAGEINDE